MQTENPYVSEPALTITCWPSGREYRFTGDPFDTEETLQVFVDGEWRDATSGEMAEINHSVVAEGYAENSVFCCQTSLVNRLLSEEIIGTDDIANEFSVKTPDDTFHALILTVTDKRNGGTLKFPGDNEDDAAISAESMMTGQGTDQEVKAALEALIEAQKDGVTGVVIIGDLECSIGKEVVTRKFIEDMDGDTTLYERADGGSDDPREILEWWAVEDFLADLLAEIGETTIMSQYGSWWGRTTSGQPFIQDGVLQRLVAHNASEG